MRQYCRYCAFCFDADEFRCSNHPEGKELRMTREQVNRENHCPNFALSDLGDVETGKQYRPHVYRRRVKSDAEVAAIPISLWTYLDEENGVRLG